MIRLCKGCGGALRFDAAAGKLSCDYCGSLWGVDEFDAETEGFFEEGPVELKAAELLGDDTPDESANTMECTIYRCNSCGAEVSINRTEASTFCIYCGNPTIVFSRVAKVNKPDIIIPFGIEREKAIETIRQTINKGFFIPREVKNFKTELVRGIYIPYYVTDLNVDDSMIIKAKRRSGKHSVITHHKLICTCHFTKMTTDASTTLSDSSSERLEPFLLENSVAFDEDYLTGFYSDMSDIDVATAKTTAVNRAMKCFREQAMKTVKGTTKEIVREAPVITANLEPLTAMFPAWFLTFRYKDQPYTILVNGQTGKIVGGVPWNKPKFAMLLALSTLVLSPLFALILGSLLKYLGSFDTDSLGKTIVLMVGIIITLFTYSINNFRKVTKSIKRTSSSTLATFVSKRQTGD